MSRAAFLATAGDPFSTGLVYKLFKKHWYDEVDSFYINYNKFMPIPEDVVAEFLAWITKDPKVRLIYHPGGIGNGPPLEELTRLAKEDLVLLLEEDGFIFAPGVVNEWFQKIEEGSYDAVGSPRGSCGQEIWDASKKKYDLNYEGLGDVGPNYWPNFFVCKREDLLKTDMDFGSKEYPAGQYFKELDHTFKEVNYSDTFVWGCIQLRHLGLKFYHVPQNKASVDEVEEHRQGYLKWAGEVKYIHGGSLSSGWGGYLSGAVPDVSTDGAKMEIETRVAFWTICSDVVEGFEEFKKEYKAGIEQLIVDAKLDRKRIQQKIDIYRKTMKL